jgi:hypothetical protein
MATTDNPPSEPEPPRDSCPLCETPPLDATAEQIRAWVRQRGYVASGSWSAIQRGRGGCDHIPPSPPLPRQYTVFEDRGKPTPNRSDHAARRAAAADDQP